MEKTPQQQVESLGKGKKEDYKRKYPDYYEAEISNMVTTKTISDKTKEAIKKVCFQAKKFSKIDLVKFYKLKEGLETNNYPFAEFGLMINYFTENVTLGEIELDVALEIQLITSNFNKEYEEILDVIHQKTYNSVTSQIITKL